MKQNIIWGDQITFCLLGQHCSKPEFNNSETYKLQLRKIS